jgi:hypothetical protein
MSLAGRATSWWSLVGLAALVTVAATFSSISSPDFPASLATSIMATERAGGLTECGTFGPGLNACLDYGRPDKAQLRYLPPTEPGTLIIIGDTEYLSLDLLVPSPASQSEVPLTGAATAALRQSGLFTATDLGPDHPPLAQQYAFDPLDLAKNVIRTGTIDRSGDRYFIGSLNHAISGDVTVHNGRVVYISLRIETSKGKWGRESRRISSFDRALPIVTPPSSSIARISPTTHCVEQQVANVCLG